MDHEEITKALRDAGYSWRAAADVMKRSATMLILVSKRDAVSRPVAKAICALIDRTPEEVFPDKPSYHGEDPKEARDRMVAEGREKLKKAGVAA